MLCTEKSCAFWLLILMYVLSLCFERLTQRSFQLKNSLIDIFRKVYSTKGFHFSSYLWKMRSVEKWDFRFLEESFGLFCLVITSFDFYQNKNNSCRFSKQSSTHTFLCCYFGEIEFYLDNKTFTLHKLIFSYDDSKKYINAFWLLLGYWDIWKNFCKSLPIFTD